MKGVFQSPSFYIGAIWVAILIFGALSRDDEMVFEYHIEMGDSEETFEETVSVQDVSLDTIGVESQEAPDHEDESQHQYDVSGKININTASREDLMQVRGIGDVLAGRIMAYRNEHDLFQDMAEVQEVHGVGVVTVERMKDHFYCEKPR
ncbi:ComEA family DNA-binding protein [Chitinivibrio alkaliphilus]|uniref:Helix-hairpin-helix DNA-binding motif class 1 domain-containing protein n=1 Tax=Chitinivibrio alkaliphilus ACht1 TaxID=1313304 RepID=U7D510_9BACT|nr:helix-hairpin-helix domain-containing protein [Chitinivibrio alkaliphilus]ERP31604.1 hypothetical protein CALK_1467 [Chitinivibrio alkaliphilus ACht1]